MAETLSPAYEVRRDERGYLWFSDPIYPGEWFPNPPPQFKDKREPADPHREKLTELLDWVQHDSWRCDHPDRYPQTDDCPCRLLSHLKAAGIDPEPWRRTPDES